MNDNMLLSIGIAQMQHVFVKAQEWTEQQRFINQLTTDLPQQFFDYTAIAFEGAAMQLAINALRNQQPLTDWKTLAEDVKHPYPLSSYLGLGMALAQLRLDPSPYVAEAPALLGGRIWAGYGYYNNFFRKRTSVDYLDVQPKEVKSLYWQGVGRSCWHQCKGDLTALEASLQPLKHKKDLWRGIGIACTYLAIGSTKLWTTLQEMAGRYHTQLAVGAIMVSVSIRSTSRNRSHELLLLWCGCDLEQAQQLHRSSVKATLEENTDSLFLRWLQVIEEQLSLSNDKVKSK